MEGIVLNLYDDERAYEEVQRALRTGNPDNLCRVLVANIWPLYCTQYALLIGTIDELPVQMLDRYPVLKAVHPMTAVLARTTRKFKPLMNQDAARTMTPVELDTFTLIQMVSFRFSGDVAAAQMFAKRLEDRLLNVRSESRERADGPLWFYRDQIGVSFLLAGDTSRALVEFGTAAQLGAFAKQKDAVRVALGHSALTYALRGSLDAAENALVELRSQPPPTAAHESSSRLAELTAEALIAVERMDDGAEELLNQLCPPDSVDATWPFALLARGRYLIAKHRPEEALELIQLVDQAHPALCGAVATEIINSLTIDALAAAANMRLAWRRAEASGQASKMARFSTIRLALHDSRFDLARELRRKNSDDTLAPGQQAEYLLLSAWIEVAQAGEIDRHTAVQIARVARRRNACRLLATMPRQLLDKVQGKLFEDELRELETVTNGLRHNEMEPRPTLTPSELRVLGALQVHESNAAIAAAFHVSPNTIKSQLKALYRKLDCSTKEGALKSASRLRIVATDLG